MKECGLDIINEYFHSIYKTTQPHNVSNKDNQYLLLEDLKYGELQRKLVKLTQFEEFLDQCHTFREILPELSECFLEYQEKLVVGMAIRRIELQAEEGFSQNKERSLRVMQIIHALADRWHPESIKRTRELTGSDVFYMYIGHVHQFFKAIIEGLEFEEQKNFIHDARSEVVGSIIRSLLRALLQSREKSHLFRMARNKKIWTREPEFVRVLLRLLQKLNELANVGAELASNIEVICNRFPFPSAVSLTLPFL